LENYVYSLKNQVSDEEQLGGKLDAADKKKLLDACKETINWLDDHAAAATTEDFEEQKEKLSQVAYPITSKLYKDQAGGEEDPLAHDEL
jgi:endoplasmic reticulum chaperone BiP